MAAIGMFDVVMVSGIGENAISAISLVDFINQLINSVLTALATGGAIVCSQYIGRKKVEDQILRMDIPGGSVFIRRSTLVEAGGNWVKLKRRITRLSEEKDIPFTDYTLDEW